MNPVWRERIAAIVAAILAVWLSVNLADGSLLWPLLVAAIATAAILVRVTGMPLDAIAIGALLIGYVVGNRGFAQFMIVPGLPLLPAEIGLAIAGACLVLRCTHTKTLPWQSDALNYTLLAWIAVGTARFAFDLPRFGFVALRDYATIYYATFFFVAQQLGRDERIRRFLLRCLLVAAVLLPVVFVLFELFPAFFLGTLVVHGVPLVYYKGDLAPTFIASLAVLLFLGARGVNRWWARPLATVMVLWVFAGDNRASLLGLAVALLWVARSRYRRFAVVQAGAIGLALMLIVGLAHFANNSWAENKLRGLTERAVSVVDMSGRFAYRSEASLSKTDNNQFRWVWWRTVTAETLAQNPALGLGFGYDLARGFLQEYNPDLAEEFTARSPHSILVTTLGRLGLVGLTLFLGVAVLILWQTWRVLRNPDADAMQVALWAAVWPIAISACLGVVLEGPMGAVVFWSLLGLAHSYRSEQAATEEIVDERAPAAATAEYRKPDTGNRKVHTSAFANAIRSTVVSGIRYPGSGI